MEYIREQTAKEILDMDLSKTDALSLSGIHGYTIEQLQAINVLLEKADCHVCVDCDLGETKHDDSSLFYNIDIIQYLRNVKQLIVSNFPFRKEIGSIDFVQYTPLLQSLTILGLIKKSISLEKLSNLQQLDTLHFKDYLDISKKQCAAINNLSRLKDLEVKQVDAMNLTANTNMKRLSVCSKLTNGECVPDKFPNLEYLYLKRQTNCKDFSFISRLENLKELYLYWIYGLETLPDLSKLHNLERLELYGCPNLCNGIEQVSSLSKLKRFCASEQTRLTVEDFENTLSKIQGLKSVHITFRNNNKANIAMNELMNKYNWTVSPYR